MLLRWVALAGLVAFGQDVRAQEYNSAIGGRLSWGGLLTYKHKLASDRMAEGILSIRWGGVQFTGLYERYFPAFGGDEFHWYAGAGLHMGFHGRDNTVNPPDGANSTIYLNPGADLIGGLSYQFPDFPIEASVDYKPSFHFTGERWFVGEGLGLSLRYCLK